MRFTAIIGAIVALTAGWYLASPYWTEHALQSALASGDAAEVARHVDFPAVRTSLKDQLDQRIGRDAGDNVFAQIGAVVGASVADRMVDWLVTPDGLRRIVATGHVAPSGDEAGQPGAASDDGRVHWHVAYRSVDRFDLVGDDDRAGAAPMRLVFHRDGLGWMLSAIELPDTGAPAAGG